MTLNGYQFDKAKVTPEADAALYSYLAQSSDNKVISGLTATSTGLNIYVSAGKALVQGRLVENSQQMQLTAQANKTGYVCITIDLTQDNTSTGTPGSIDYLPINNQLRLELVDNLTQQDLNNGGLIYTFPLYSYVSTGATVTLTKIKKSYRNSVATTVIQGVYSLNFTLRRTGDTVELVSDRVQQNLATAHDQSDAGVVFPSGFRPVSRALTSIYVTNGSSIYNPMILRIDNDGKSYITNEGFSSTRVLQTFATWQTNDPWPDL
jgi:hypothetical protein